MSRTKIRAALVQGFSDGAFFASSKIAIENKKFTPPTSGPWCKLIFLPTQPYIATLGPGGQDRWDGILQVDLNYPLDDGESAINAKADAIGNTFTVGRRFVYEGVEVIVRSCGSSQGANVNGFYRISISIVFYSHVTR